MNQSEAMPELPKFRNLTLLQLALTHRSYVNEHPEALEHNERLEFLGDAILNFLSGEFLYKRYPKKPEGELTPLRSALVDEAQLAKFAIALNLGEQLQLGKGAELEGGRHNPNLLSSAFEAIVGAYFLDRESDIAAVREWVCPLWIDVVVDCVITPSSINYKSRFQEWALANGRQIPKYTIVAQTGPDHAREFTAIVELEGKLYGTGKGRKKQDAEKEAAKNALEKLGLV